LEALSRGAAYTLFIDDNAEVISQLKQHLETLQSTKGKTLQGDALHILSTPPDLPFDIVFLDPPFNKGLITPCVEALESNGWLSKNARIYIEVESSMRDPDLPDQWKILRQQKTGQVACYLTARHPATAES
jgi:16S rRNA (guanine966-N2)-methyltransferase